MKCAASKPLKELLDLASSSPLGDYRDMEIWLTTTTQFDDWRNGLGPTMRIRVDARVQRAHKAGHFGDHHGLKDADEISEMRIDAGPGYRLYYTRWEYRGHVLLMLLGGDKSTQRRDIRMAKTILKEAKAKAEREIDRELEKREEEKHGQR